MNLSDFIATTLGEVMKGVTLAAEDQKSSGRFGFINPMDGEKNDDFSSIPVAEIQFDVAITVESSSTSTTGGSLGIKVIEAKRSGDRGAKFTGESRVKFAVPVCLPTTKLSR